MAADEKEHQGNEWGKDGGRECRHTDLEQVRAPEASRAEDHSGGQPEPHEIPRHGEEHDQSRHAGLWVPR